MHSYTEIFEQFSGRTVRTKTLLSGIVTDTKDSILQDARDLATRNNLKLAVQWPDQKLNPLRDCVILHVLEDRDGDYYISDQIDYV